MSVLEAVGKMPYDFSRPGCAAWNWPQSSPPTTSDDSTRLTRGGRLSAHSAGEVRAAPRAAGSGRRLHQARRRAAPLTVPAGAGARVEAAALGNALPGVVHQPAQAAEQPFVVGRPAKSETFPHGLRIHAHRDPQGQPDHRDAGEGPQRRRQQPQEGRLGDAAHVQHVPCRPVVLQDVGAHVVPVPLEVLPAPGDGLHREPVQRVPADVLVEERVPLRFGEAAAEPLGHLHGQHEERGVRPVERARVEGVVRAAVLVDPADRGVVAAHLTGCPDGERAVVDHSPYRVQRAEEALPALLEEARVLGDARAQLGVHVLHRSGPGGQEKASPVAEPAPGEGVGAERLGRSRVGRVRSGD